MGNHIKTYIPNLILGPILVHCGGAIGTYTAHLKILKWKYLASGHKLIVVASNYDKLLV